MNKLKLLTMSDIPAEEVRWLWYPYLPRGKITIIQGDPGEGKTTFVLALAALLTRGLPMPGQEENRPPMNIIYQTAEDGLADTVKSRLTALGADCSRVLVIDESERELTLSDRRLAQAVEETGAECVGRKHRPAERVGDLWAGVIFHPLGSARGSGFRKSPPLPVFYGFRAGIFTDFRRIIMPREKIKFALRISPETQQLVKEMCPRDNCRTQNEFIEKAIRFYAGYISGQEAIAYLPPALVSVLRATIQATEDRICRLLFKLAVEQDMVMNVLAAGMEIPDEQLKALRGRCVQNVKRTNGSVSLDKAVRYQRGDDL